MHELDRLRPEIASALARTEGDAREILAPLAELLAFRMSADDARTFGPSVVRVESPDPWVLAGGAQAAFAAGDLRGADDLCTWARSTQGGGRVPWLVDWVQGAISLFTGSFADARARYDRTRAVATDPWARAFFAAVAAHAAAYGGDHDAPDVARAAVLESEAIDNPSCQAWAACALALSVYDTEPRVAWDSLRDAERLAAAVSNQVVRDVVRQRRAELDGAASDSHIATVLQSLDEWERRGNRSHAAEVIARAMPALAERGAHRSLAVLHGAIDNAPGAELRLPGDQRRIQSAVEEAQASLGEDGFQQARRRGAGLPFDEALEFARHALRDVLPHR